MAPSKPKDDSRSTKLSTKLTTSSLAKKASNGFNKLKCKATKLLSPKKKKESMVTAPSGTQGMSQLNSECGLIHLQPFIQPQHWSWKNNHRRQLLLTSPGPTRRVMTIMEMMPKPPKRHLKLPTWNWVSNPYISKTLQSPIFGYLWGGPILGIREP